MSKRKLPADGNDDDCGYGADDYSLATTSESEEEEGEHIVWPADDSQLNQPVTISCGIRGSFAVPRGCLNQERWAMAFTGDKSAVSTAICMQTLACWTNAIPFPFLQAWASFILIHQQLVSPYKLSISRVTLAMTAAVLRHRAWLRRVLLDDAVVSFSDAVECCQKTSFRGQDAQIELALEAVYNNKVASKDELAALLTQHEEDAQDAATGQDGDVPRMKTVLLDDEQYLAYLRRYLRRNISNPVRKQVAVDLIDNRQRAVFCPDRDFTMHNVDAVDPEYVRITQDGIIKRVKEEQVSGNPTSRRRWLSWKVHTVKRLLELENMHSRFYPKVIE